MFKPTRQLNLEEGDTVYQLFVSEDDYKRAHLDPEFASSLLYHAKVTSKCTFTSSSNNNFENSSNNNTENLHALDLGNLENVSESQLMPPSEALGTSSMESGNKGIWSYEEISALINSMATHIDDLNHPKKRKHIYENIANDLTSAGYDISSNQILIKWKSLMRSYKASKDNNNKTGRAPSRFLFFDQMDHILGNKPAIQCSHAIESSIPDQNRDDSLDRLPPEECVEQPIHQKNVRGNLDVPL